jgi:nitrous oxidase accessory protein NosD
MEGLGRSAQGIYAARVAARHAGGFIVDRNEISGFGVGVEIREGIPSADISANEIRGNRGIGIYCAAQVLAIRGNRISGARGITIPPTAGRGSCTDNLVQALAGAVENGRGRAVEVRGNVIAQRRS